MENQGNAFEGLFNKTTEYLETRVDLMRLKATAKTSELISSLVSRIVIVCIACMVLILISIGFAIWLGTVLNKMYLGFFGVGVFYMLVILVLFLGKNHLMKTPIKDSMIKNLLK